VLDFSEGLEKAITQLETFKEVTKLSNEVVAKSVALDTANKRVSALEGPRGTREFAQEYGRMRDMSTEEIQQTIEFGAEAGPLYQGVSMAQTDLDVAVAEEQIGLMQMAEQRAPGTLRGRIGGAIGVAGQALKERFAGGDRIMTFFDLMYLQRLGNFFTGEQAGAGLEMGVLNQGLASGAAQLGGGMQAPQSVINMARRQTAALQQGERFTDIWGPVMGMTPGQGGAGMIGDVRALGGPALQAFFTGAFVQDKFLGGDALYDKMPSLKKVGGLGGMLGIGALAVGGLLAAGDAARDPIGGGIDVGEAEASIGGPGDILGRLGAFWEKEKVGAGGIISFLAGGTKGFDEFARQTQLGQAIAAGTAPEDLPDYLTQGTDMAVIQNRSREVRRNRIARENVDKFGTTLEQANVINLALETLMPSRVNDPAMQAQMAEMVSMGLDPMMMANFATGASGGRYIVGNDIPAAYADLMMTPEGRRSAQDTAEYGMFMEPLLGSIGVDMANIQMGPEPREAQFTFAGRPASALGIAQEKEAIAAGREKWGGVSGKLEDMNMIQKANAYVEEVGAEAAMGMSRNERAAAYEAMAQDELAKLDAREGAIEQTAEAMIGVEKGSMRIIDAALPSEQKKLMQQAQINAARRVQLGLEPQLETAEQRAQFVDQAAFYGDDERFGDESTWMQTGRLQALESTTIEMAGRWGDKVGWAAYDIGAAIKDPAQQERFTAALGAGSPIAMSAAFNAAGMPEQARWDFEGHAPIFQRTGAGLGMSAAQVLGAAGVERGGVVGTAFEQGFTIPGTEINVAGLQGTQLALQNEAFGIRRQQLGISQQRLAGQYDYTMSMWDIQDRMTAQSRAQQDFNWGMQGRRMDMQESQFMDNQAFAREQAGVQAQWGRQDIGINVARTGREREWRREDWAIQDSLRATQWGWQQQDFQENIRFSTGRQRRLQVRGRERATFMHQAEEEQIERERERQKEREGWQDEDFEKQRNRHEQNVTWQTERFDLSVEHFNEQMSLNREAHEESRKFMDERRALEDELRDLQRDWWKQQHEFNKQQMSMQAAQLKNQEEQWALTNTINQLLTEQDGINAEIDAGIRGMASGAEEFLLVINDILLAMAMENLSDDIILDPGGPIITGGGNGDDHNIPEDPYFPPGPQPMRHGGPIFPARHGREAFPGGKYLVGDGGVPELFIPDRAGRITPFTGGVDNPESGQVSLAEELFASLGEVSNLSGSLVVIEALKELVMALDDSNPDKIREIDNLLKVVTV
jgi:hypothetical protein